MKIERVGQYIASKQNKIDRTPTGGTVDPTDLRGGIFVPNVHVPSLLTSSFRTAVVSSRLSGAIAATDPFVTKICCDPRRKFALAAELQEGRVGRNEDLSRPCRKENTSRHV